MFSLHSPCGVFKMLMANEAKPERTIKFLNAILGLAGDKAITGFTLGVPENPGVLNDKTAIFDIYGTTAAGEPVLIEVQQNYNVLFVDRLVYYTSRVISHTVKKSQKYDLPHIYVLSILTKDQFPLERDRYFHHSQIMRNRHFPYEKLDVYFVELQKFFAIEDRTSAGEREVGKRADMLRLFRAVLEEKEVPNENLLRLLDSDFMKDVSFRSYSDELLLHEVDGMTDMLYEKQGSYLQGKAEGAEAKNRELAKAYRDEGVPIEVISRQSGLAPEEIKAL